VDHFRQLLEKALFDVNSRLEAIRFLSKHEKKQLLYDFNDTGAGYPENKTIYELFSEQVKKNPDRIALVEGDRNLGCRELNQRANRLAHLLRKKGVKPDTIVGIMLERSIQLVMGILAILKAGGAYLPIDTESPTNRVTSLLNDTRAPILLTDSQGVKNHSFLELQDNFLSHQAPYTTADILLMDDLSGCFTEGTGKNPEPGSHANNLAYTIFTSGSTGIPKGVLIDHGSLVNYTHWAAKNYLNTNENQVVYFPFYTSSAFDLTVTSLFLPLITGNTIIIYSQEHKGLEITKAIDDIRVGIIKLTPSHLKLLREKNSRNPNIQCLITGGEELETRLARDIGMHFSSSTKIFNEYGPTEATVGCMIHQFNSQTDTGRTVPIGIPADNVQIHILDQHLEPLPVGGIGEIYISGFGIARGYLNNPEITMKRFIRNPFVPGKIMYKSGDMAKRLANGTIEFLGRIDQQVKIKGCRIEPGEIEHKLTTCPGIKEAIVLVRKDNDGNDDRQLAAYWVPEDHDSPLRISVLKDYLAGELPEYMIPDYFVKIDGIPLTVNGKVDVKTLPEVESIVSGENYVGPRNQLEEKFVEVWQEVLRIERVGINDNFFELGGDSLKAIQLASKLNHTDFTIDKLFIHQTINRICSSLVSPNDSPDTVEPIKEYPAGNHRDNDMERTSSTDDVFFSNPSQSKKVLTGKKKKEMIHQLDHNGKLTPLLKMNKTRNKYPIAPVQQSFFSLPYQAVAVKNTIHHYDFPGSNIDHIKKIVVKLINENSLMRSIIEKKNGSYSIVEFDSFANIEIPFLDISNYSSHCNEEILNMLYKNLCKPLELLDELLYRVCVVKTDNKTLKLIFAMNHLIFDGESIKILKNKIQNITERPGEFKETRMKKKDYYDYVKFMLDLSYEGIDLEKHANFGDFFKYGNKIHEKFEIGEIGYGDLEIDIGNLTEDLKNYYNEMMLLCYANLINELWDTRGVSLLFASNGRNYKDGNFNDILGDFHDIIPVFLSFEKNPHPQKVIEEFINYRQYIKNHNINFVNYFRKTPRLLKKYLRIPTSPFIYNSLIGMYHFLKNKSTDPVSREVEKQNIKGPYFELYVSKDIYSTKLYVYFQQNSRFTPEEIKNQLIKNFKDLVQRLNK
jgi:amino acid adenylation domain-containing protein